MAAADWDMHAHGSELVRDAAHRLPAGACVVGTVVCHHPFGLGLYVEATDEYGHVNIPEISAGPVGGPDDFPAIGSRVAAIVLGYTGIHAQLRLSIRRHPEAL